MLFCAAVLVLLPLVAGASLADANGARAAKPLEPRKTSPKPRHSEIPHGYSRERLHLKFAEDTGVRLRGNRFVSESGADVSGANAVLTRYPGLRVQRLFSRSEQVLAQEKTRIEQRSGRQQADKNLWYRVLLRPGTDAAAVLDDLNALRLVEIAFAEPLPAPAPVTPDFEPQQGYLDAATDGIDADFAWTVPGGTGGNVSIIDIEYSWNQSHEDLSKAASALIPNGTPNDPFSSNNHGTAVVGELVADDNGFGVTGIAHDAGLGLVNADNTEDGYDLADSIDIAHAALGAGDVIIIEQQVTGAGGDYVAVEWVEDYYDAIVSAVSDGIIVLEAAGNGNQNLDDSGTYGSPFPDGRSDSGAIIVGAGAAPGCTSPTHGRLGFSTYGARVDVQGWGECVVTTGYGSLQGGGDPNLWYTNGFNGTSSATPIVTGAAAVISSIAQQQGVAYSPAQVRSLLVSTGTPQDTSSDSGHIGPLPNLRAALEQAFLPTAHAGGPYTTAEGTDVTVNGGTSTDPQGGPLTYAWDLDNDGFYDDATGSTATFDTVGQDGVYTIGLKVTDAAGASDTDTTTVTVTNAAPTITAGSNAPKAENTTVTVSGVVTDAGWLDDLSATVDWGDGTTTAASGTQENVRPNATLSYSATHIYGDDGTFTVEVCGFDDDTSTCTTIAVLVTNVPPTSQIDESGTTLINGVPTVIAHAGDPVSFSGNSTDPGSDDLTLSWNWDDGSPVEATLYLNDPNVNPDPDPSPSIHPRDVTDTKSHTFGEACFYVVGFGAADDDGGVAPGDTINVIIAGNALVRENAGYWQTQYRPRPTAFSEAQRLCYLEIVGYVSQVFDEVRNASDVPHAFDVLFVGGNGGSATQQLDRQLLAAWLNFANGAIGWDQLVDTDGNGTLDTAFSTVMTTAEAVRLNPLSSDAELHAQRDILQRING